MSLLRKFDQTISKMEKDGIEVDLAAKRRVNSHRMSIKAKEKPSI